MMDRWVHDITAGQAPMGLHPHRQIAFLHIELWSTTMSPLHLVHVMETLLDNWSSTDDVLVIRQFSYATMVPR